MQRLRDEINTLHQQDKSPVVVLVIIVLISTGRYVWALTDGGPRRLLANGDGNCSQKLRQPPVTVTTARQRAP